MKFNVIVLLALFAILTGCEKETKMEILQKSIDQRLDGVVGNFAVAYLDLNSGDTLLMNSRRIFHAASTMKTPVLIEVYKQASEGKFNLTDSIEIKTTFISLADGSEYTLPASSDSEKSLYEMVGKKKTIASLTYDMVIKSSNLATNLIVELVGADNATNSMRELGAHDIQVLRGVEDLKAYEEGMNNITTAYDLMLIFSELARGNLVSEGASAEMVDILMDQQFNHIIPAKLPANVKVAHKTGAITGVQHDSGIVFLPDGGSYVLILLSSDHGDREAAEEALADISKIIYDFKVSR
ncbi:serine hydrolase [Fulvivirga sedimenti]|uniref:beta-lactamase n=1 Tax=Fulvivirga sedimenti TaxID=2879465 RepID=A0A9X1HTR2_9BACT|nr:serine hydrolase [Fulvivirga sedimenti]MCA6074518.1 class A beta-lactamase-related serine hydrolase [Fulvivirga sedimenti]MCA6075695.1 class A beta-lactamase-related serine hydrolase [Fulvivirga sedimenti]MCA6076823.1 class A beta-lactamase-related serine hydrolase [Fulvivirga sedimenti]